MHFTKKIEQSDYSPWKQSTKALFFDVNIYLSCSLTNFSDNKLHLKYTHSFECFFDLQRVRC